MPIKGLEYIMDGGSKSNKMLMKKMMLKNNDMTAQVDKKDFQDSKCYYYVKMAEFYIQYIIMPIIILLSSTLSILNLIVWDYYIRGYINVPSTVSYLRITDYVILLINNFKLLVICFSLELIFNIAVSNNLDEIFDFENFLLLIYDY